MNVESQGGEGGNGHRVQGRFVERQDGKVPLQAQGEDTDISEKLQSPTPQWRAGRGVGPPPLRTLPEPHGPTPQWWAKWRVGPAPLKDSWHRAGAL